MNANTESRTLPPRRAAKHRRAGRRILACRSRRGAGADRRGGAPTGRPPLLSDRTRFLARDRAGRRRSRCFSARSTAARAPTSPWRMIVAEEMDVPLKSVSVVQGDTARTVNQGGASGSTGVRFAGAALRSCGRGSAPRAGQPTRPRSSASPPSRLTVNDGVVSVAGDPAKKISYAELIGGGYFHSQIGWNKQYGNPLALTSPAKPKTPDQYKIVGTSPPRLDVEGKVFGTTPWVQDIRVDGMLHGRMIRPPVAGASVVSVDESSIARHSGRAASCARAISSAWSRQGMGRDQGGADAEGDAGRRSPIRSRIRRSSTTTSARRRSPKQTTR